MSLQVGFFYRMDANSFRKIQSLRQTFDVNHPNEQYLNFLPLLEFDEGELIDFNLSLNQIRKYAFLMNDIELNVSLPLDSYQIINSECLEFSGNYRIDDIADILIDLKILFENRFKNITSAFNERFLAPRIIGVKKFDSLHIEDILTLLHQEEKLSLNLTLLNFGYIDHRSSVNNIVRFPNRPQDGPKTNYNDFQ